MGALVCFTVVRGSAVSS